MVLKSSYFFIILGGIWLTLLSNIAEAGNRRWTHFGVRPLAMGNAYVSVADDFNALFYNPAGLARIKEWDGELLNPYISIGSNSIDLINEVLEIQGSSTAKILDLFEDKTGRNLHGGFGLTPHLIFQNWGFGIGFHTGADITGHSEVAFGTRLGAEIIAPFTYARNFLGDKLSVGATIKARSFAGVDTELNIETIGELTDEENNQDTDAEPIAAAGTGVGLDVGILFTPMKTMEPTIGISITDLGGTTYTAQGGGAAPRDVLPSVNTGFSITPVKSDFHFFRLAIEAHSINQPLHYSHKLHLGAEWGVGSLLKIQAGMYDGLATGGLEFDVGILNMRLATYAVDHGTVVAIDDRLVDRRYVFQVKLLI